MPYIALQAFDTVTEAISQLEQLGYVPKYKLTCLPDVDWVDKDGRSRALRPDPVTHKVEVCWYLPERWTTTEETFN
jgi:hypothetical protein